MRNFKIHGFTQLNLHHLPLSFHQTTERDVKAKQTKVESHSIQSSLKSAFQAYSTACMIPIISA